MQSGLLWHALIIDNAIQHLQEHVSLLDNNIYLSPLVSSLHVIHYNTCYTLQLSLTQKNHSFIVPQTFVFYFNNTKNENNR